MREENEGNIVLLFSADIDTVAALWETRYSALVICYNDLKIEK